MCFALLLLTITIYSCKKSETPVLKEDATTDISASIIAKIKEIGFTTDGIKESGDYYLVEGDILISNKSLSAVHNAKKNNKC